ACSSDDDGTAPRRGVVEIQVSGPRFSPSHVEITPGTTVRRVPGGGRHTITPDDPNLDGESQVVNVTAPGAAFAHGFEAAGHARDCHCVPHRDAGMTGRIRVVAD